MIPQTFRAAAAFAAAAARYWLCVFPEARGEIRRLRRRARQIPDPGLRALALDALERKSASLEGAAAFATFAPWPRRAFLTRLLVDLQAVFDYADTLMEQPSSSDQAANARWLHSAFMIALRPDLPHQDYYQHHDRRQEDGGYLVELVNACRDSIRELPSYQIIADMVTRHAERVLFYQSGINLAGIRDHPRLARWAAAEQPRGQELAWWELGAACGSSLAVFAHLAAAVDPSLTRAESEAIEALYWPWAEALHILLDSLIDRAEDHRTRQHNLLDHYQSGQLMAERLELLARRTVERAALAPSHHRLILAGMVGLYLSDEEAWTAPAQDASRRILIAAGPLARLSLLCCYARAWPRARRS